MTKQEGKTSDTLLQQRVRNGIIEYLEVASSFEEQVQYQERVSYVNVAKEMINSWEDWADESRQEWFSAPVFSQVEQDAIRSFHETWNFVADNTSDPMPELDELIGTKIWEQLRAAAESALSVFAIRGRLSDDVEEF